MSRGIHLALIPYWIVWSPFYPRVCCGPPHLSVCTNEVEHTNFNVMKYFVGASPNPLFLLFHYLYFVTTLVEKQTVYCHTNQLNLLLLCGKLWKRSTISELVHIERLTTKFLWTKLIPPNNVLLLRVHTLTICVKLYSWLSHTLLASVCFDSFHLHHRSLSITIFCPSYLSQQPLSAFFEPGCYNLGSSIWIQSLC